MAGSVEPPHRNSVVRQVLGDGARVEEVDKAVVDVGGDHDGEALGEDLVQEAGVVLDDRPYAAQPLVVAQRGYCGGGIEQTERPADELGPHPLAQLLIARLQHAGADPNQAIRLA